MLFNSYVFIFAYLPIVFVIFYLLGKRSHRLAASWLGLASLFFYGWWDVRFVPLLIGSILANYTFGVALSTNYSERARKTIFVIAVASNLGLLAVMKYTNFFILTVNDILQPLNAGPIPILELVLPLGISFFTFTQIAFLVDTYRSQTYERNFIHYLLFVSYFPHLIAGPIIHHKQMMPQFSKDSTYSMSYDNIAIGITIFTIGLFKKVIFADGIATYANGIFNAVAGGSDPTFIEAWGGAIAYTLQLYFDFSGYCDMAIGLSLFFNIRLPINFNSPYKSSSIIEFWRRWHMTLSAFLRDYLYIPLGGNRYGKLNRYRNLMVTMLLGGLWHGAGWTFVLWGGLHGLYIVINNEWKRITSRDSTKLLPKQMAKILGIFVTFLAVVVAWVPFRSESLWTSIKFYYGMLGFNGISFPASWETVLKGLVPSKWVTFSGAFPMIHSNSDELGVWLLVGLVIVFTFPNAQQIAGRLGFDLDREHSNEEGRSVTWRRAAMAFVTGALLYVSFISLGKPSPFLYFQF
ncbi:MAG: MBOAT family protein [Deltaproteobacteria bacterium]|nr:MBOAT family protein [Deltaproteobacteria bacterium]